MFLSRGAYSLSRRLTTDLTMPQTTGVIAVGMPLGMTGKITHTDLEISTSAGMICHIVLNKLLKCWCSEVGDMSVLVRQSLSTYVKR